MSLLVTGVDTGMNGAMVSVRPDGELVCATVLFPGKRDPGWRTPSPGEVERLYGQMAGHLYVARPGAIVYEQVSVTRGVGPSRSLFICEGLLLKLSVQLGVPIFGVQQQSLRAWVKRYLGIAKWRKGEGKAQILEAMPEEVMRQSARWVRTLQHREIPDKRRDDVADAYLTARWGQEHIETGAE